MRDPEGLTFGKVLAVLEKLVQTLPAAVDADGAHVAVWYVRVAKAQESGAEESGAEESGAQESGAEESEAEE
jgi:hypothetical protein